MKGDVPSKERSKLEDRIDEHCDAFESAWRSGERPSIVDFIQRVEEPYREALFCELLLVELECRRYLGEQPAEEQYLRDFPEFAAQMHAVKFQYGSTAFFTTARQR